MSGTEPTRPFHSGQSAHTLRSTQRGRLVGKSTLFQAAQPRRLYEHIVDQVDEAVASGRLRPGERLPSERELVSQFAASRATVREALRVLESNGVVRSHPGDPSGPEVLPFSTERLEKQITRLTQLNGLSLTELIGTRMILDSSANWLAARLRSEDDLAALDDTITAMRDSIDLGYESFSQADVAFHEAVAQASKNKLIQVCNQVIHDVVLSLISDKIARSQHSTALMQTSLHHHEDVLAAIKSGDGHLASALSRRSMYDYYADYVPQSARANIEALLDDGLDPDGVA